MSAGKKYPRKPNVDSARIRMSKAPSRPGIERDELARTSNFNMPRIGASREGAKEDAFSPSLIAALLTSSSDRLVFCSCLSTRIHQSFCCSQRANGMARESFRLEPVLTRVR